MAHVIKKSQTVCICEFNKPDSVFKNGDFVKYKTVNNNTCQIKIGLGGKDTLLSTYSCPLSDEIPDLYYHAKNLMEFTSGNSSGERYFTICEFLGTHISVNTYYTIKLYTPVQYQTNFDVFVFKKSLTKKQIFCKGIFSTTKNNKTFRDNNMEERAFDIPLEFQNELIESATLYPGYIKLKFSGKKEVSIKASL